MDACAADGEPLGRSNARLATTQRGPHLMAWVSYRTDGQEHVGIVEGDFYVPLEGIHRIDEGTGLDVLQSAHPASGQRISAAEVELLPPSWAPQKVFCVGLNYNEHIL